MLRWILRTFGLKWVGARLHDAAEGVYGPKWQAFMIWVHLHAAAVGVLVAVTVAALSALGYSDYVLYVGGPIATLLVGAGCASATWRQVPPWIISHPLYVFAQKHTLDIAAGSMFLEGRFTSCSPETSALLAHVHLGTWSLTCTSALMILTGALGVLGWLGLDLKAASPPRASSLPLEVA